MLLTAPEHIVSNLKHVHVFVLHRYRRIEALSATARRMNWPEGALPSNSLMNSRYWGSLYVLSNEFSILGIPLCTCKLIIDRPIVDLVHSRWAASDTGSPVIVIITGHCIMGTHANEFCRIGG